MLSWDGVLKLLAFSIFSEMFFSLSFSASWSLASRAIRPCSVFWAWRAFWVWTTVSTLWRRDFTFSRAASCCSWDLWFPNSILVRISWALETSSFYWASRISLALVRFPESFLEKCVFWLMSLDLSCSPFSSLELSWLARDSVCCLTSISSCYFFCWDLVSFSAEVNSLVESYSRRNFSAFSSFC